MAEIRSRHLTGDISVLAAAALAGIGAGLILPRRPRVPEPCREVELAKYMGKWFELARYENRFEAGMEAVTAEYGLLPDGKVSVRNRGRLGPKLRVSTGKAKLVPGSSGAKLKVSFFGPFYVGNYWVLDRAEDYSWSIVGEPSGRYLWILARDAGLAEPQRQMLFRRAAELGYDVGRLRVARHQAEQERESGR